MNPISRLEIYRVCDLLRRGYEPEPILRHMHQALPVTLEVAESMDGCQTIGSTGIIDGTSQFMRII